MLGVITLFAASLTLATASTAALADDLSLLTIAFVSYPSAVWEEPNLD
jgi:hypothetical protein